MSQKETTVDSCRAVGWFSEQGIPVGGSLRQRPSSALETGKSRRAFGSQAIRTKPYTRRNQREGETVIKTILAEWAYVIALPKSDERQPLGYPAIGGSYNAGRCHMLSVASLRQCLQRGCWIRE